MRDSDDFLDDFHVFKSTSSGGGSTAGSGRLGPAAIWVLVILAIIGFIAKLAG